MVRFTFVTIFALFVTISLAQTSASEYSYHVKNKVVIRNEDNCITRLSMILPLAQSNQYQTISHLKPNGGERVNIPESDDAYLRWNYTDQLPGPNESKEIYYEFDVTIHPVNFDFSSITRIYPYNTSSSDYKWYIGKSGAYVDPSNAVISETGDRLWAGSANIIDYAMKCYNHVAATYKYINPFTGLHTLQDILNAGGGDCGNLSSIFISLLRYKNIPARHIVTVRPDGVYHVWADFYLEKYGWIPVDVTFKNSDPKGDYFGKFDGNGIVMTKDVWLLIDKGFGENYYGDILQSYTWWVWRSQGTKLTALHQLTSIPFKDGETKSDAAEISASQRSLSE